MEDTEDYLNTILKKRANAVSTAYGSQSKSRPPSRNRASNNVTRIPVTQEKE